MKNSEPVSVREASIVQASSGRSTARNSLIGWLLGSWADRHFHQGWIGITGIVLGAVGGFIQIFATASRFLKKG